MRSAIALVTIPTLLAGASWYSADTVIYNCFSVPQDMLTPFLPCALRLRLEDKYEQLEQLSNLISLPVCLSTLFTLLASLPVCRQDVGVQKFGSSRLLSYGNTIVFCLPAALPGVLVLKHTLGLPTSAWTWGAAARPVASYLQVQAHLQ